MSMQNLYQQDIFDHYQNPRHYGLVQQYDFISPMYNPSCGDSITICGSLNKDRINKTSFEGKGCVVSIAMASKLMVHVHNKTIQEILAYDETLVEQLLTMQLGLKRMQCGLLSLHALQNGIKSYISRLG